NALRRIDTLFLLNAVTPDELTQALIALNLAREAGIQRIVYWSVFNADLFVDVPHFAAKGAVEKMIAHLRLPATVLRSCHFSRMTRG
ncbi:MAG TPA: NmrA family NAD(P)-binding protein, partial [Nitrococcus sp.]|nr:NmrA family NAD(P)-binding protein [Nitrococcus sp.]